MAFGHEYIWGQKAPSLPLQTRLNLPLNPNPNPNRPRCINVNRSRLIARLHLGVGQVFAAQDEREVLA